MQWHRHIDKQEKSSFTIESYCDRHQLSTGMFYYWKRKLKDSSAAPTFAELQIYGTEHSPGAIHVRFPSGVEVSFESDPGTTYLRSLAGLVVSEDRMRQAVEPC